MKRKLPLVYSTPSSTCCSSTSSPLSFHAELLNHFRLSIGRNCWCPELTTTPLFETCCTTEVFSDISLNDRNYLLHRMQFVRRLQQMNECTTDTNIDETVDQANHLFAVCVDALTSLQKVFDHIDQIVKLFTVPAKVKPFTLCFRPMNEISIDQVMGYAMTGMIHDISKRRETVSQLKREVEEFYGLIVRWKHDKTLDKTYMYQEYLQTWKYFVSNARLLMQLYVHVINMASEHIKIK